MLYFKVINPYYLEYESAMGNERFKSYLEELEDEGNLNLKQKYFDNILLFSDKSITEIGFEIFITFNECFRKKSFFNNVEDIQHYFLKTYDLPFFFQTEPLINKPNWEKIAYHITYDDFKKITKRIFESRNFISS
jgi:hypothetical protein